MRYPTHPADFAALPDDTLVSAKEIVSTAESKGIYPFRISRFWEDVRTGRMPKGTRIGNSRLWTAGQIRAAIAVMLAPEAAPVLAPAPKPRKRLGIAAALKGATA